MMQGFAHLDYLITGHFGHSSEDLRETLLVIPPMKKPMEINCKKKQTTNKHNCNVCL